MRGDHTEAEMPLKHIVQLNCRSAALKIGHTAESSGGCGTGGEKGLSQEGKIPLKAQQSGDVHRRTWKKIYQAGGGVNKAAPAEEKRAEPPLGCRSNAI